MYYVICVVYVRATAADLPPRVLRLSGGQEVVGAVHQGIAVVQFYTMTLQGISIVVRYVGVWWGNRNPTNKPPHSQWTQARIQQFSLSLHVKILDDG